jgi:hypothetical protein
MYGPEVSSINLPTISILISLFDSEASLHGASRRWLEHEISDLLALLLATISSRHLLF